MKGKTITKNHQIQTKIRSKRNKDSSRDENHLHESEQEPARCIADWLLTVAEALNDSRNKGIEMQLKVVAGEDGGGRESLEGALRNPKVVVLEEIQAAIDEGGDFGGGESLSGRF